MVKKSQIFMLIALIIAIIIIVYLTIYIFILKLSFKTDNDYQKLEIGLKSYNIRYYTVYEEKDITGQYKVYKLSLIDQKEEFRKRLEES